MMQRRRRDRAADRGSGPVTAIMMVAFLALLAGIGITAALAAAGDERSSADHAADAAALAGARGILDDAPLTLTPGFTVPSEIPVMLGGAGCVGTGQVDAYRLAKANGASLTGYCYNVFTDTVTVSVRMDAKKVSADGATASAEASTRFDPTSCTLPPGFVPGPGALATDLTCGGEDYPVLYDVALSRFHFVGLALELADLEPRLTA